MAVVQPAYCTAPVVAHGLRLPPQHPRRGPRSHPSDPTGSGGSSCAVPRAASGSTTELAHRVCRPFAKRARGGPLPVRSHPTVVRPALGSRPTPPPCSTRGTTPRPRRHPAGQSAKTSPRPVPGPLNSTHNASPGIRRLPGGGLEPPMGGRGQVPLVGHPRAALAHGGPERDAGGPPYHAPCVRARNGRRAPHELGKVLGVGDPRAIDEPGRVTAGACTTLRPARSRRPVGMGSAWGRRLPCWQASAAIRSGSTSAGCGRCVRLGAPRTPGDAGC